AQGSPELEGFSCGQGEHEDAVDGLVQNQYTGTAKHQPSILVMQDISAQSPRTMGVVAWRPERSKLRFPWARTDEQYVHVIGVSRDYREHWLDGGVTVGRTVLNGALHRIANASSSGRIPSIWAFVAPENERSRRMFALEGFEYHRPIRRGTDGFVYRPPGLP